MAYVPNSGSVVAFQDDPSKLQASITGVVDVRSIPSVYGNFSGSVAAVVTNFPGNQSVSGTVQTDVRGSVATVIIGGSIAASFTPPANQSVSGTVGASIIGLPPVNVTNFPVNQNVSGSVVSFQGGTQITSLVSTVPSSVIVGASIFGQLPGGTAVLGSVATLQGTNPWVVSGNVNASGSVAAWLQSTNASVITVGTAAPNQSVSGTVQAEQIGTWRTSVVNSTPSSLLVGASIIGLTPVNVTNFPANQSVSGTVQTDVRSSVAVAIISGSIAASFTPPANQSVSGTVGASVIGTVPVTQATTEWTVKSSIAGGIFPVSGSVAATVTNFPTNQNVSGSVVSFQGTSPWLTVPTSGSVIANQGGTRITSVISSNPSSMLVGASIIGLTPVSVTFPTNQNVSGSVVAFQGTSPWVVAPNNSSMVTISQGSVAVAIVSGSVAVSVTPPANQSVSGTVQTDVRGSVATVIIGGSIAASFTPPANQSVSGAPNISLAGSNAIWKDDTFYGEDVTSGIPAVALRIFDGVDYDRAPGNAIDGLKIYGSVQASLTPAANQSVSGTIQAEQIGAWRVSVINSTPSSLLAGVSVIGLTPVNVTNTNINVSGSVAAFQAGAQTTSVVGSVTAYQGAVPWIVNFQNSSIIAINAGSVITINPGSIITVAQANSIVGTYAEDSAHTTAERGLFTLGVRNDTVASFVGTNLDYTPFAVDSAGRILTNQFAPEEARVEGYNSVVSTSVTNLVPAAGAGLRNYITDIMIANTGATAALITFRSGGGASILGYTIAPAGGGSNMMNFATPMRTLANQTFDFQPATASSVIYATVKGFKAP